MRTSNLLDDDHDPSWWINHDPAWWINHDPAWWINHNIDPNGEHDVHVNPEHHPNDIWTHWDRYGFAGHPLSLLRRQ